MDMREKVARALLEMRGFPFSESPGEEGQGAYDCTIEALAEADAVLAALGLNGQNVIVPKEPTEAMKDAHFAAHARSKPARIASVEEVWSAMLESRP